MARIAKWGCGIAAGVTAALGLAFCVAFTDASSHQPAEECIRELRGPILAELAKFPIDVELMTKGALVEHVLYGNEDQARGLVEAFSSRGWKAKAEPMDEIGWGAILTEDAVRFRAKASERIGQLCVIAEQNGVEYRTWRLSAPGMATHVSQNGDAGVNKYMPSE